MTSLPPVFSPSFILHIHILVLKIQNTFRSPNFSWRAVFLQNPAPLLSTLRSAVSGPGSEQIRVLVSFSSFDIISNATSSLLLFNKDEFSDFSLCKSSSFFKGWFKYCFLPGTFANFSSLFSKSPFYWCLCSNLNSDLNHISCIIYSYHKMVKNSSYFICIFLLLYFNL